MPKLILIYSDGTGQRGGLRPDQTLSNIYKMFRATRPGPASAINPSEQIAFYDPGLGKGEVGGWTFKRTQHLLEAAIGTGIDTNIIDCYEKILATYNPGDKICLFGFSRGAYTVRALASLMNLCGVPTQLADGKPLPRHGKVLRKIATEAVQKVYNHGAGKPRDEQPYFDQREELGRRFRLKYKCSQHGNPEAKRGNVEPHFIGVFDTVAALGSNHLKYLFFGSLGVMSATLALAFCLDWPWLVKAGLIVVITAVVLWLCKVAKTVRKTYSPVSSDLNIDLLTSSSPNLNKRTVHWAFWKTENYDRYLSGEVYFARHAVAIDEERANFPRVAWGPTKWPSKRREQTPIWIKQVWFAGCHSDIGGSYPEDESRLSDIALTWMIEELRDCVPEIQIVDQVLQAFGDPAALQHEERWMIPLFRVPWKKKPRYVYEKGELHPSVYERFNAGPVPIVDEVIDYRPVQLKDHVELKSFYK
jgi:uncharacterized protein (DUF2235 family)